jgi:hypothetical protein
MNLKGDLAHKAFDMGTFMMIMSDVIHLISKWWRKHASSIPSCLLIPKTYYSFRMHNWRKYTYIVLLFQAFSYCMLDWNLKFIRYDHDWLWYPVQLSLSTWQLILIRACHLVYCLLWKLKWSPLYWRCKKYVTYWCLGSSMKLYKHLYELILLNQNGVECCFLPICWILKSMSEVE